MPHKMAFKRGISMGISAHLSSLGSSLSDRDADKWNLLQKVFYHAELRKLNENPLYKLEPDYFKKQCSSSSIFLT